MKSKINICRRKSNGTLLIVETKIFNVQLDEEIFELFVVYQGQQYFVKGDCFYPFIIIEDAAK